MPIPRRNPLLRAPRFPPQPRPRCTSRSNAIAWRLDNFYDFRNWRDVTRYKTRLQDALHSTGSTRLPRVTVTRPNRSGPTP
jgi:hypothetical protein